LRENDPQELERLWLTADAARRQHVGDSVHLRGLVEISSHCINMCLYCGLRASNRGVARYRMTRMEILECAALACRLGYGTVVLQAGHDEGITGGWLADVIRCIKTETPLAITLSLGERAEAELRLWRDAGADRYLLRFETSNRMLYERIHPSTAGKRSDRIAALRLLRAMGYEVGSGVMIGIPGQRYDDLADDIAMFAELDLDMVGVGPFIPHPSTPLGRLTDRDKLPSSQQVPASELMTYKVVALTRIVCPNVNIPATTALGSLKTGDGRETALRRGANVIMPNLTPACYRRQYEIYPGKVCVCEDVEAYDRGLRQRLTSMGRKIAAGRGDSPHYVGRVGACCVAEGG